MKISLKIDASNSWKAQFVYEQTWKIDRNFA